VKHDRHSGALIPAIINAAIVSPIEVRNAPRHELAAHAPTPLDALHDARIMPLRKQVIVAHGRTR